MSHQSALFQLAHSSKIIFSVHLAPLGGAPEILAGAGENLMESGEDKEAASLAG